MAYVLSGKKLGDHAIGAVLDTIPVLPGGWTDLAEIRKIGRRWAGKDEEKQRFVSGMSRLRVLYLEYNC